jgi:hypothetical protein
MFVTELNGQDFELSGIVRNADPRILGAVGQQGFVRVPTDVVE